MSGDLDAPMRGGRVGKGCPVTLVIVDMQGKYSAATDPETVRGVLRQVALAKRFGWSVVVLEFRYGKATSPAERTSKVIMDKVKALGARRYAVVPKEGMDGSKAVVDACRARRFGTRRFRLCGVYTGDCVLATVRGLSRRLAGASRIEVVKGACNDTFRWDAPWHEFTEIEDVVLI